MQVLNTRNHGRVSIRVENYCFAQDDACLEGNNGHGTISFSEKMVNSKGTKVPVPVPIQPQKRAKATRICPPRPTWTLIAIPAPANQQWSPINRRLLIFHHSHSSSLPFDIKRFDAFGVILFYRHSSTWQQLILYPCYRVGERHKSTSVTAIPPQQ